MRERSRGRGQRGRGRGRGGGRVGRGRGRGLYVTNDTQLAAPQTSGRGQQRRRKIYQDYMPQKVSVLFDVGGTAVTEYTVW